jgi:hypothetical protein
MQHCNPKLAMSMTVGCFLCYLEHSIDLLCNRKSKALCAETLYIRVDPCKSESTKALSRHMRFSMAACSAFVIIITNSILMSFAQTGQRIRRMLSEGLSPLSSRQGVKFADRLCTVRPFV